MLRRERLLATLQGHPVDRPSVSFYELDGQQDPTDSDQFNIFNHPSWKPLLELAKEKTDIIFMQSIPFRNEPPDPVAELRKTEKFFDESGNYITVQTICAGSRLLVLRQKRERDINTVWTVEYLCKDIDDFEA